VLSMAASMYITMGTVVNKLSKQTRQKYSIQFRTVFVRVEEKQVRRVRIDVGSAKYGVRLNSKLSELLGFGSSECEFAGGNHVTKSPDDTGN